MSLFLRLAVIAALIVAALTSIAVTSALNTSQSGSPQAEAAIQKFEIQSASDSNIYQQQVSALWANKDLLKVVADETANANRLAATQLQVSIATNWLLAALVGVLSIMALGRTSRRKSNGSSDESTSPSEGQRDKKAPKVTLIKPEPWVKRLDT